MIEAIVKMYFNNEVCVIDKSTQLYFEGVVKMNNNFAIITNQNKGVDNEVIVPMTNISAIRIKQIISGKVNNILGVD